MANPVTGTGYKTDHLAVTIKRSQTKKKKKKRSQTSFFEEPSRSLYLLSLGI